MAYPKDVFFILNLQIENCDVSLGLRLVLVWWNCWAAWSWASLQRSARTASWWCGTRSSTRCRSARCSRSRRRTMIMKVKTTREVFFFFWHYYFRIKNLHFIDYSRVKNNLDVNFYKCKIFRFECWTCTTVGLPFPLVDIDAEEICSTYDF